MKFSKKTLGAAMLLAGALGTQSAHAIIFTNFDAVVDTTFTAFTGSNVVGTIPNTNPAFPVANYTHLQWGTPISGGGPGSSLNINNDGSGGPGRYTTNIDAIGAITGSITHNNVIIDLQSTLRTFEITNVATFTPTAPPPGGGIFPAPPIMFNGTFTETPNSIPCVVPGTNVCADIFVFNAPQIEGFGESTLFATLIPGEAFGGDVMADYWLEIFDSSGSLGTLSDAECIDAGALAGCRGFTTEEGKSTTLNFSTRIIAHPRDVPEPVSLALLGIGLIGMSIMTRRRKKVD